MRTDIVLIDRVSEIRNTFHGLTKVLNDFIAAKTFANLPYVLPSALFHSDSGKSVYFALKAAPAAIRQARYEDLLISELEKHKRSQVRKLSTLVDTLVFDGENSIVEKAKTNLFIPVAVDQLAKRILVATHDSIRKMRVVKDNMSHFTTMADGGGAPLANIDKLATSVANLYSAISTYMDSIYGTDMATIPDKVDDLCTCLVDNFVDISDIWGKAGDL